MASAAGGTRTNTQAGPPLPSPGLPGPYILWIQSRVDLQPGGGEQIARVRRRSSWLHALLSCGGGSDGSGGGTNTAGSGPPAATHQRLVRLLVAARVHAAHLLRGARCRQRRRRSERAGTLGSGTRANSAPDGGGAAAHSLHELADTLKVEASRAAGGAGGLDPPRRLLRPRGRVGRRRHARGRRSRVHAAALRAVCAWRSSPPCLVADRTGRSPRLQHLLRPRPCPCDLLGRAWLRLRAGAGGWVRLARSQARDRRLSSRCRAQQHPPGAQIRVQARAAWTCRPASCAGGACTRSSRWSRGVQAAAVATAAAAAASLWQRG